jgi:hypothetical protein
LSNEAHKFPGNCLNYTHRSERQAWTLLTRSYQAAYYSKFHIPVFLGAFWRGFGGVGAVYNTRGLVYGCVNRARKSTPLARVVFLESKRANTHMTQVWVNTARCKHARAIGLWEGRGPTWPLGTHHVDGGVWNAWVCACANHTRPTRGARRELGSEFSRNEELVNTYRQTPHKSPHEVSRIRCWVLLGTAAQLCRNNLKMKVVHIK